MRREWIAGFVAGVLVAVGIGCWWTFGRPAGGAAPATPSSATQETRAIEEEREAVDSDAAAVEAPSQKPSIDAIPESDPADPGMATSSGEGSYSEALDALQGWWIRAAAAEDPSQALPAYVFDGATYYEIVGNGQAHQNETEVTEDDITREPLEGQDGWRMRLGGKSVFVPDTNPEAPLLVEEGSIVPLVRGEGELL